MKWPVTSTQDEPVLDEGTFQQLLAASYTLQEHADRLLANEARTDCARTLGAIAERVGPIQALRETPETGAHPVSLMEPVFPVAHALQEQADRLVANEARTDYAQTLSAGANNERDEPIQILPETRETVAHPVSLMEPVLPVPQADMEPSEHLNNPPMRPAVMALIAEINGLLEANEERIKGNLTAARKAS